jgi:hypothetical protein
MLAMIIETTSAVLVYDVSILVMPDSGVANLQVAIVKGLITGWSA